MIETIKNGLPAVIKFEDTIPPEDFITWYSSHNNQMEEDLFKSGAILFKNIQMTSILDFERIVKSVGHEFLDYIDVSYQRRKLSEKVYISTEYDKSLPIKLHSELSYANYWPSRIFFGCLIPPDQAGETSIADTSKILSKMDPAILSKLREKKLRYVRNLHSGVGLGPSWADTFKTDNKKEVEKFCEKENMSFQWGSDDSLKLEAIRPPVRIHPQTLKEVWFSVAELYHPYHFDAEYYQTLLDMVDGDCERLPLYSSYGDGSPIPNDVISEIIDTIESEMLLVSWEREDLLLVDNMLCSHGRMPYSGDRQIVVFLSN